MQRLTQEELNEIAKKHENWLKGEESDDACACFIGVEICRLSFKGMRFDRCKFINSIIHDCNIQDAIINRAKFDSCIIRDSNFTNVEMVQSEFHNLVMKNCTIVESDVHSAITTKSTFDDIAFKNTDMIDTRWEKCSLNRVNFIGCNCIGLSCKQSDLFSTSFQNSDKSDNMEFRHVWLDMSTFSKVTMYNATFDMCLSRNILIEDSDVSSSYFSLSEMFCGGFKNSDFTGTYFSNCDISDIEVENCQNFILPGVCPETGSFIGYKRALAGIECPDSTLDCIVELEIPETSRRVSTARRSCRTDIARVRHIWPINKSTDPKKFTSHSSIDYTEELPSARSNFDHDFKYINGEPVRSKGFCDDPLVYGPGIHFFLTKDEALNY